MSRRTPVVSLGQGDYRRDYYSADDFRSMPLWFLAIGLALGVIAALVIDSTIQPSGARTDESRPAQTASAGLLAPEAPQAR